MLQLKTSLFEYYHRIETMIRRGEAQSWLAQLIDRRPRNVATVALANKNARIVWALLTKGQDYQLDYTPSAA